MCVRGKGERVCPGPTLLLRPLKTHLEKPPTLALHRVAQGRAGLAAESLPHPQHCLCPLQHLCMTIKSCASVADTLHAQRFYLFTLELLQRQSLAHV